MVNGCKFGKIRIMNERNEGTQIKDYVQILRHQRLMRLLVVIETCNQLLKD